MNKETVKIKEAKGRPMLTWVGKRPLRQVTAFPAQKIETFDPTSELEKRDGGMLLHGDNKEVLAWLLANGYREKVKLIYIDPPFDSGANYIRQVKLKGINGIAKLNGEEYSLGEQIQYTDIWTNDAYLQFMYERLAILKEVLAEDGSIWLHCDWRKSHHLRLLLDEIFSPERFMAHVVWRTMTSSGYKGKTSLGKSHADILYYAKGKQYTYNPVYTELSESMIDRYKHEDPDGRKFKDSYLGDASPETIEQLRAENLLYVTSTGGYRIKHYLDEAKGVYVDDVWTDIDPENSQSLNQTDYPTQKSEELLERIIRLATNPGDLVLDCFIGSGTTPAVAQKLGRRWIACDINKGSIQTTSKRLQNIIYEQINTPIQLTLEEDNALISPAQLSFSVYRVNDYDLQIQRNEAMQLAMEHVGITPNTADPFFDGTRGKQLAKVIPFERPLTLLDLESIKQELDNRPDESRGIVVVCLGKETAVDGWLEEWNRLRKTESIPNKIEIIELRTDPRYGKFFVHEPAKARVNITRAGDKLRVTIEDFISPSIIERLKAQAGLLAPQIDDWRAMVDSVMIDTSYNGQVFNVALSDVPAKRDDLVIGSYELPAPDGETTVAVKVTDMLGEEVLEVLRV